MIAKIKALASLAISANQNTLDATLLHRRGSPRSAFAVTMDRMEDVTGIDSFHLVELEGCLDVTLWEW